MLNDFNDLIKVASSKKLCESDYLALIPYIANKEMEVNDNDVRALIRLISNLFKQVALDAKFDEKKIRAIMTKFRDAGRRSAPWRPTSSKVPGRPQDGEDGNRTARWLLDVKHKFYATEVLATLVEVKYYLQTLSMEGAPDTSKYGLSTLFTPWLLEHKVDPGKYSDPIQLDPINFNDFIESPRSIQSGHIFPLDRGGVHHPSNTFLMLFRSNQIQGNMTVDELLKFMRRTISRHDTALQNNSILEEKIRELTV
ncbi:hypothetical protein [Chamaesiphon sp. VAR_48_metabat_403]|uniref:hypothetical protein n=1 Tax=Chamaesiphon sp. VAR_48_metabat_403 TaxID=2964700 RepID=UPI00286DE17A|nr:hypothetical protein [Chamaesiphon sp. VAR_48_metabat_403]